jgi:hypothetical protein
MVEQNVEQGSNYPKYTNRMRVEPHARRLHPRVIETLVLGGQVIGYSREKRCNKTQNDKKIAQNPGPNVFVEVLNFFHNVI